MSALILLATLNVQHSGTVGVLCRTAAEKKDGMRIIRLVNEKMIAQPMKYSGQ